MIRTISIIIFGLSVLAATPLAGMLVAERLYDRAVSQCDRFGGTPAAIENRVTYACVTPTGGIHLP